MRVFFDMEFTGLRQDAQPISLACVSENGKQFYAEFIDYDPSALDEWVSENVHKYLWLWKPESETLPDDVNYVTGDRSQISLWLSFWLGQFGDKIEMWGDVSAYDWVLFCELFRGSQNLPPRINYIMLDLATLLWAHDIDPDINREEYAQAGDAKDKHNALHDAWITKRCFERVTGSKRSIDILYFRRDDE